MFTHRTTTGSLRQRRGTAPFLFTVIYSHGATHYLRPELPVAPRYILCSRSPTAAVFCFFIPDTSRARIPLVALFVFIFGGEIIISFLYTCSIRMLMMNLLSSLLISWRRSVPFLSFTYSAEVTPLTQRLL